MKRVIIVVEGQTEEEFIKKVFAPYFVKYEIYVTPIVVRTSQNFKGGIVGYQRFKNDVNSYLKQNADVIVSSLIDYFRLPTDFPFYDDLDKIVRIEDKVKHLEKGISTDVNNDRFIPYIQLHEFEALLFSDVTRFSGIAEFCSLNSEKIVRSLETIMDEYDTPEQINSRPEFAPSKRILKLIPGYNKVLFGTIVAEEIGMQSILDKCPRFKSWVESIVTICR